MIVMVVTRLRQIDNSIIDSLMSTSRNWHPVGALIRKPEVDIWQSEIDKRKLTTLNRKPEIDNPKSITKISQPEFENPRFATRSSQPDVGSWSMISSSPIEHITWCQFTLIIFFNLNFIVSFKLDETRAQPMIYFIRNRNPTLSPGDSRSTWLQTTSICMIRSTWSSDRLSGCRCFQDEQCSAKYWTWTNTKRRKAGQ